MTAAIKPTTLTGHAYMAAVAARDPELASMIVADDDDEMNLGDRIAVIADKYAAHEAFERPLVFGDVAQIAALKAWRAEIHEAITRHKTKEGALTNAL